MKFSHIETFCDLVLTTTVASFPTALPATTHKTRGWQHRVPNKLGRASDPSAQHLASLVQGVPLDSDSEDSLFLLLALGCGPTLSTHWGSRGCRSVGANLGTSALMTF